MRLNARWRAGASRHFLLEIVNAMAKLFGETGSSAAVRWWRWWNGSAASLRIGLLSDEWKMRVTIVLGGVGHGLAGLS